MKPVNLDFDFHTSVDSSLRAAILSTLEAACSPEKEEDTNTEPRTTTPHGEALKEFREWCRREGKAERPPIPSHVCSPECTLWRWPKDRDVYLCVYSKQFHLCGEHCDQRREGGEGDVCPLTGRCLAMQQLECGRDSNSNSEDDPGVIGGDGLRAPPMVWNSEEGIQQPPRCSEYIRVCRTRRASKGHIKPKVEPYTSHHRE